MTTLILMRHGQAGMHTPDLDRPLTASGADEAAATGDLLRGAGLTPDLALVSPARRTRETFAATGLGCTATVVDGLYECGPQTVLDEVNAVDAGTVLVVAHFPAMPQAAELLAPGAALPPFSTATAVAFALDEGLAAPGSGRLLTWFAP
ncbi:histidine phosphatase family protein [Tsukamurella sp. 8F]|uniref:SixA phosphatase family protein n=1 Tax=unclassified Tsukamurella TaxID=2633480 RepID=UPI0023B99549|nr:MULTISPECIES: histidine phosphatase family protein [unclassified Tsukamurella]MDF0531984.1 histidine phosphatase family protein [Tsukamurella sp. 8J]MDF0588883.1 histidine phosphatase family protein [Tsukamurella sp. 8F]